MDPHNERSWGLDEVRLVGRKTGDVDMVPLKRINKAQRSLNAASKVLN